MRISRLLYIFLFFMSCFLGTQARTISAVNSHPYRQADSIMREVVRHTAEYRNYVRYYKGESYTKGTTHIEKCNWLFNTFPGAFPFDRHKSGTIFEIMNEIEFWHPSQFVMTPKALHSTNRNPTKNQYEVISLLCLNMYTTPSRDMKFIMPGTPESEGIYEYRLMSTLKGTNGEWHKIRFLPKRKNLKLLSGYLYVRKGTPLIRMFFLQGWMDIAHFKMTTRLGNTDQDYLLPIQTDIRVEHNILNNVSAYDFHLLFQYNDIKLDTTGISKEEMKLPLDQTRYFTITTDSIPIIEDSTYWESHRKFMLTEEEEELYGQRKEQNKLPVVPSDSLLKNIDYLKLSEKLVSSNSFGNGSYAFKYSGLLNPAMISYSKNDGIKIRQRLRLRKTFDNGRYLGVMPEIGFGFKRKELFYRFDVDLNYHPERLGNFNISFRNGNRGFSSAFIDEVNSRLDSTKYNFDHLNINYYRDYHLRLENAYELWNGVLFYAGISYNYRKPVKEGKDTILSQLPDDPLIRSSYADFVPYLRLAWTPQQYYRMIGHQKVYLQSRYPTFELEYAKGLKGVCKSTSRFDRAEFNIHQTIPLNKLRLFSYRAGIGGFFNQKGEYFVNYRYFWKSTYPESWEDHIGGVFNLLDNMWYYASPAYAQIHVMYESPFLLLHFFRRISRYVLTERLYASQLYTPAKPSYTELGYGLGNYIFNVGVFTSLHKGKFHEAGFKITFELDKYW